MTASDPRRGADTAPQRTEAQAETQETTRAATRAAVRIETLRIRTTAVGPANPLPPVVGDADLHEQIPPDGLDTEMARGLAYGKTATVLPYLVQDAYGRELAEHDLPVAVLENDAIRAVFLTGLGGRLWSLTDKRSGRELLHSPRVLRPANLALRNAWFAGGVEWNLGTTGHWPLTCSPLHVARVERADGTVALRLYEYERMRGLVVRIDAALPAGSALLTVTITLENPRESEVPVYWWSNIAVPEHPDTRVIVPAAAAWRFGYSRRLDRVPFPSHEGIDHSYTTRAENAVDFFFDLDDAAGAARSTPDAPARDAAPGWIAALDREGSGLFQLSGRRMRGRKLFRWGTAVGGTHWQDWLGDGSSRYLEIQAGLARTQLEHLPMPAGARWRWTEVYGLARADPAAVHGEDWDRAVDAAADAVLATGASTVAAAEEARDESGDRIVAMPARGSGWGALEDARRRAAGEPPLDTPETPFPASDLGAEQTYWLALLQGGPATASAPTTPNTTARDTTTPDAATPDAARAPVSYQADPAWLAPLAARDDWLARLHRGVIHAAEGDLDAAARAWRSSTTATDNGWARRNLARAAAARGDHAVACSEYARARELLPGLASLATEAIAELVAAGHEAAALRAIETLTPELRASGRIRFAEASAALAVGDLDRCGTLLESGIEIPDLREGELSLDRLWLDYQAVRLARAERVAVTDAVRARAVAEHPVPHHYDFRMHAS